MWEFAQAVVYFLSDNQTGLPDGHAEAALWKELATSTPAPSPPLQRPDNPQQHPQQSEGTNHATKAIEIPEKQDKKANTEREMEKNEEEEKQQEEKGTDRDAVNNGGEEVIVWRGLSNV